MYLVKNEAQFWDPFQKFSELMIKCLQTVVIP